MAAEREKSGGRRGPRTHLEPHLSSSGAEEHPKLALWVTALADVEELRSLASPLPFVSQGRDERVLDGDTNRDGLARHLP